MLVAAEAHAKAGSKELATKFFADACSAVRASSLETFAEINRVAAILAAPTNHDDAQAYLARACRTLTAAGLLGVRADVHRTARQLGLSVEQESASTAASPIHVLQTIAAALQLGKHPQVLGPELLTLLNALDLCEAASVTVDDRGRVTLLQSVGCTADDAHQLPDRPGVLSFALGGDRGRNYYLRALPKSGTSAGLVWPSVAQVIRAARESAAYQLRAEEEIALWPPEPTAHQLGMVVAAENMVELVNTSRRLAPSTIPVLITGETGTGKELLARALHDASPRKDKPFIPFNCSAVARDMLDAQLFGYRRGAFTGAHDAFQGVIRAAVGGTLFLDEIGEITPAVQPKLLRFLESGEIHPLGEPKPLIVDVRVVAATNANLEQLVADGRFREDLFYRLNVVRLQVPPLRERREEIPVLVQHYLDKCSREALKTGLRLAEETMEYLMLYKWPGNVRQLANEVRRLVALAESGAVLMPEHLSSDIAASRRTIPASERDLAPTEFVVRMDQPMSAAMEHLERSMIQYALKLAGHRVEEAAQLLGLSRKGLYLKRQRLGIESTAAQQSSTGAAVLGQL